MGDVSVAALMFRPVADDSSTDDDFTAVITIDPSEAIARDKNFASAWRDTYKSVAASDNFRQWRRLFGEIMSIQIALEQIPSNCQRITVVRRP